MLCGQRKIVYKDPITRKRPEGLVQLVRRLDVFPDKTELWRVHFISDPPDFYVTRTIAPSTVNPTAIPVHLPNPETS